MRVGRLVTGAERVARMAAEDADRLPGEVMWGSAFAISGEYVLTAWHCVRGLVDAGEPIWFRIRAAGPGQRYAYLPLVPGPCDGDHDVAVLHIDTARLAEADLCLDEAGAVLAQAALPLGVQVAGRDGVQVVGFPDNAPAADAHPILADVVDVAVPFGPVTVMKLTGPEFAAFEPLDPRGMSGGPVIARGVVVGLVRAAPRGASGLTSLGAAVMATRIEDVAAALPEIGRALLPESRPVPRTPAAPTVDTRTPSLVTLLRADAALVDFIGRRDELSSLQAVVHERGAPVGVVDDRAGRSGQDPAGAPPRRRPRRRRRMGGHSGPRTGRRRPDARPEPPGAGGGPPAAGRGRLRRRVRRRRGG